VVGAIWSEEFLGSSACLICYFSILAVRSLPISIMFDTKRLQSDFFVAVMCILLQVIDKSWSLTGSNSCAKPCLIIVHVVSAFVTCCQDSAQYATPAGTKVARDVTTSAFRNVSYQRATHESLMGDSVENQSPDGATARKTASSVSEAAEVERTTVEHSEVERLTCCDFMSSPLHLTVYPFAAFVRSFNSFVRTNLVTMISHEWLEQYWRNLQRIFVKLYWWPGKILEVKGQRSRSRIPSSSLIFVNNIMKFIRHHSAEKKQINITHRADNAVGPTVKRRKVWEMLILLSTVLDCSTDILISTVQYTWYNLYSAMSLKKPCG